MLFIEKERLKKDVSGQSTASSANIHQWGFHGETNQQWKITKVSGNWYSIRPQHAPSMAMDVGANSPYDDTNIIQYTYNGGNNQLFGFVKSANGSYRIVTRTTGGAKELSVNSRSTANSANIAQHTYNSKYTNDNWFLEQATSIGAAKAYRQVNNTNINCLGYALERSDWPPLSMSYGESAQTVYNRLEALIESTMNRQCRQLTGKDDLIHPTREYKIVMRVGNHKTLLSKDFDYHFMVQTNTGGWAHKQGGLNSRNMGSINPSTYDWKRPTAYDSNFNVTKEESFYDSDPIYFAVTR